MLLDRVAFPHSDEPFPLVGKLVKVASLDMHCRPVADPICTIEMADGSLHVCEKSKIRLAVIEDLL